MLACCPRVTDDALVHLARWKSVRYVDVQETKVTAAGVAALRKSGRNETPRDPTGD